MDLAAAQLFLHDFVFVAQETGHQRQVGAIGTFRHMPAHFFHAAGLQGVEDLLFAVTHDRPSLAAPSPVSAWLAATMAGYCWSSVRRYLKFLYGSIPRRKPARAFPARAASDAPWHGPARRASRIARWDASAVRALPDSPPPC